MMKRLPIEIIAAIIVIAVSAAAVWLSYPRGSDVHIHADFAVYLGGAQYNFSQEKYMSGDAELSGNVHLHDMDGNVVHVHAAGVTLGEFFGSLGMKFNESCFVTDASEAYCSSGSKTLKLYVNGFRSSKYDSYVIKDLDRILVTFGEESESVIKEQINSVTGNACVYSEKCSGRGAPPPEGCAGNSCPA